MTRRDKSKCGQDEHCCHLGRYGVCQFLEEGTVAGRHWACGLLVKSKTWAKVYKSAAYKKHVQPFWDERGGGACGDWPPPGETCQACGEIG